MAGYVAHSDFARVYGDMGTGVWVAPKGSTLPTTLAADPDAAFQPLGWLHPDGMTLSIDKDVKDFNALQGGSLIRRRVGKVNQKFTFIALEETALVLGLVHAGQEVTVTTGTAKIDIATDQAKTVERSLVVDMFDGTYQKRFAISAADITFQGEIQLSKNDELTAYKFEASILAGATAYMLTNSPGVVAP